MKCRSKETYEVEQYLGPRSIGRNALIPKTLDCIHWRRQNDWLIPTVRASPSEWYFVKHGDYIVKIGEYHKAMSPKAFKAHYEVVNDN